MFRNLPLPEGGEVVEDSIKDLYFFQNECRCDERLKAKVEGSTRLPYIGLCGGSEHLQIRLIDERQG